MPHSMFFFKEYQRSQPNQPGAGQPLPQFFAIQPASSPSILPTLFSTAHRIMTWQQFLLLASAHFLALLSPGPDFFLVIHHALAHGRRAACLTALGIACANGVFILAAIAGIALLREATLAYALLYWSGCAYLGWLAWQFWRAQPDALVPGPRGQQSTGPAVGKLWLTGFASGILNPKNALFYLTLFTLLAGKDSSLLARTGAGIWMFSIVLAWDCLVGTTITQPAIVRYFNRQQLLLHRGSACVLGAVVVTMIWHALPVTMALPG